MKTILVFVATLDGKVTKWGDPHVQRWSSKEDREYFKRTWESSPVILIGSGTFDADPLKPVAANRVIVLTHDPLKYKKYEVPGQVEFTSDAPDQLVKRFQDKGLEQLLVVGGPHVATSFLKLGLIDELWITFEPKIFGKGGNFVIEEPLDIELRLMSFEQMNEEGTINVRYAVLKK